MGEYLTSLPSEPPCRCMYLGATVTSHIPPDTWIALDVLEQKLRICIGYVGTHSSLIFLCRVCNAYFVLYVLVLVEYKPV